MESKLINYSIFIEKRPDMEIHTEVAIVSCINSAYVLLDGECASLISQVDKFNMVDDRSQLDTNHELYRTDFELGQLQEALVFQVQYVLNMGNDFTVGGGSYSIGNINSSYSRPEGRELIAPGVYKLLSNARVYHLNAFGSFSNHNTNEIPLSTSKEIMERVKNEYVAQNQPNAQVGNVAYINQSHQVSFGSPQDLQITTYNTNRIAGPEGYRNNFYEIDSVPNIAFFGPDYNGTYSAVHRQEMIDYVNQNAGESLGQEIAQIKQEQEEQNNKINQNKNLIDSTYEEAIGAVRKNAEQDETIRNQETRIESNWNNINNLNQRVGANTTNIQTNTNNITALDSRLVSVSGLLNQTIDGLRTLRPFKYVGEYQNGTSYNINQLVSYNNNLYLSKEDNNTTIPTSDKWLLINKDTISVDLSDYPTKLEVNAIKTDLQNKITANTTNITDLQNNVVKISGNQTIAGTKTFNNQIVANEGLTTGATKSITSGYLELGFGNNVAYITPEDSSNKTLKFSGRSGRGRFDIDLESQSQLMGIKDPTRTYHAANKNYVDNLNNQNVKLAGQQTITGRKIFTGPGEGIQIRPNATGGGSYIAGYNYEGNTKKWVLGNTGQNNDMLLEASAGSINLKPGTNGDIYCYGKQIKNVADPRLHNDVATKRYVDETVANVGQGGTYVDTVSDQSISGNKVFQDNTTFYGTTNINNGTLATVGTNTKSLVNKEYVDTNINTIKTGYVNTNSDQTINGLKIFNNTTTFEAGTTIRGTSNIDTANIADGSLHTVNNDSYSLVNKDYVDRVDSRISTVDRNLTTFKQNIDTSLYTIYSTGNTIYNNLQKLTTNIFNNSSVDYKKPLTVSFTRTNNSGADYGSYTFQIQYGVGENNFVVGSNLYYDRSKTYGQLGDWVALTITPSYIQVQCWNGGDRIKNIKVQGWKKVI